MKIRAYFNVALAASFLMMYGVVNLSKRRLSFNRYCPSLRKEADWIDGAKYGVQICTSCHCFERVQKRVEVPASVEKKNEKIITM